MNIREICEKQGLTIAQLAHKLGVSENLLYKVANGSRQMSRNLEEKIKEFTKCCTLQGHASIQLYSGNNCTNTGISIQESPKPSSPPPPSEDLAIVPTETLTEHIEVVQQNNELLQEVRETQEQELRLKREQGRQLSEVLEFVQGLDEMMQKRVREIIDERTRTIIAATNHHIHTQAQVMITAIEGIINMVEAGVTNPDIFLRQLRAVRAQLEKMAEFKQ